MKKVYFISSLIISSGIYSQVTLTQQNSVPQIGETYTFHEKENTSLSVANAGPNQVWDFSSLSTGTVAQTDTIINLASSLDGNNFPQASSVTKNDYNTGEGYLSNTSTSFVTWGAYFPNELRLTYSDPEELLVFPITYNTAYNETFSGVFEDFQSSLTFQITGVTSAHADAYGDVILPYGTISNTLRIKTITTTSTTYMGQSSSITDTSYLWYDGINHTQIAVYNLSDNSASYIDQASLINSVAIKESLENVEFEIYPNPSADYIFINDFSYNNIYIYNSLGAIVYQQNQGSRIDISSLPKGVYYLKLESSNAKIITKKLIKK